ncbi:MAG TPA: hypothetical protein VKQ72_03175 [Aggregatilineales bacterium]|nr:hypothetical protein [Aggregatilineales bacterium]
MSDKPLFEFRMVNTDNGIRFEVNADKERLHELAEHRLRRQRLRYEGKAWERWERRFWRHGWCFGPWWDEEGEEKSKPTPPAGDAPTTA